MQALFQFDVRGNDYARELDSSVLDICRAELMAGERDGDGDDDAPALATDQLSKGDRELLSFATRLVEGTLEHRDTIDERLQAVTRNWDLRRMAVVDRNVLRMAVYELMFCTDVPPKVAINEAIEIGKKFSTANSGGFVNGILDRIRIDIEQARGASGATADGS